MAEEARKELGEAVEAIEEVLEGDKLPFNAGSSNSS